jgi:cell shape-determining protein MreD
MRTLQYSSWNCFTTVIILLLVVEHVVIVIQTIAKLVKANFVVSAIRSTIETIVGNVLLVLMDSIPSMLLATVLIATSK